MEIVLIRLNRAQSGGAERYLERLEKELKQKGIKTVRLHSFLSKKLPGWIRLFHFYWTVCKKGKVQRSGCYFSLERLPCAKIYRAGDGVHRIFLRQVSKPFWFLNPLHYLHLYLERLTFQRVDHIIANSEMVKREIVAEYQIPTSKISVVYNGIPIPPNSPTPSSLQSSHSLRHQLGIPPNVPIILLVGSGFKRKGVGPALKLLSQLPGNWRFIVVGKEKRLSSYQKLAKKLGLGEKVHFTGPRSDVERFYQLADILLLPTHYDPFANVILEGMVYQVVPITTRQNGASELLPSRWIMEKPTDNSILPYLKQLLSNRELLIKEKKLAYQIGSNYSIGQNVAKTLQIISKICRSETEKGNTGKNCTL